MNYKERIIEFIKNDDRALYLDIVGSEAITHIANMNLSNIRTHIELAGVECLEGSVRCVYSVYLSKTYREF